MKKLIAMLFVLLTSIAQSQEIVVVSAVPITKNEAIDIFSFRSFVFPDGSRVKMIILPRDSFATRELSYRLGISPTRFFERAEMSFSTGKLNMLKVVDTDRELIRAIALSEGSIGYAKDYIAYNYAGTLTIISIR